MQSKGIIPEMFSTVSPFGSLFTFQDYRYLNTCPSGCVSRENFSSASTYSGRGASAMIINCYKEKSDLEYSFMRRIETLSYSVPVKFAPSGAAIAKRINSRMLSLYGIIVRHLLDLFILFGELLAIRNSLSLSL